MYVSKYDMLPDDLKKGWLRENTVSPLCVDCGVDTFAIKDTYVVNHDLWQQYGAGPAWYREEREDERGCLCVECFEKRLGRKLKRSDFTTNSVHFEPDKYVLSERLRNRIDHG